MSSSTKQLDKTVRDTTVAIDGGLYGCTFTNQYLLHDPKSLPRYRHLALKALMHYGGDQYNPHVHGLTVEPFIREITKEIISYKVFYRLNAYDWQWIDHALRKAIGGCLGLNLAYDQDRINAGFKDDAKAATLIQWHNVT